MEQRTMQSESLLFIGDPDHREQTVLDSLGGIVRVKILANAESAYQEIASCCPDFLIFSAHQQNTCTLRLFRQLKRMKRLCVVVCHEGSLQAFIGKGYCHRCWLPKSIPGATVLQNWKRQMLDLSDAEDQRRIAEATMMQRYRAYGKVHNSVQNRRWGVVHKTIGMLHLRFTGAQKDAMIPKLVQRSVPAQ